MSDTLIDRLFHYTPSNTAAIIFVILDILIIIGIVWTIVKYYMYEKIPPQQQQQNESYQQDTTTTTTIKETSLDHRGVRLLWIVAMTAIFLIIGLGLRIQMNTNAVLTTFIVQQAFLIISPNALAFVNYSLLGIILRASEQRDPTLLTTQPWYMRSKYVARLFLASDVFSFFIQSTSTPMLTNADPTQRKNGQSMMVSGLILQLVFFTMYAYVTIYVHRKRVYASTRPTAMNSLFRLLYFTIAALYIRSIYRLVEFAQGYDGSIARMEWLFYVADQVPVTAAMAAYLLFKPVAILKAANDEAECATSCSQAVNDITIVIQPSTFKPESVPLGATTSAASYH